MQYVGRGGHARQAGPERDRVGRRLARGDPLGEGSLGGQARPPSAGYSLKAGTTRNVTVKLPSVAKRLAKSRSLKVRAQAISKDVAGTVTTKTADVTLKFPR